MCRLLQAVCLPHQPPDVVSPDGFPEALLRNGKSGLNRHVFRQGGFQHIYRKGECLEANAFIEDRFPQLFAGESFFLRKPVGGHVQK